MIKTVIFDLGGVLIGYDWDMLLMKLFNDKEKAEAVKKALFSDKVWDETDRGVWSEEELLAAFCQSGKGIEREIHEFWDHIGEALWQFDFTKGLIQSLKDKGYQVLYLSNWSAHLRVQAAKQLDFIPMMDGGVFSYEEKLIKPDHRIYERILDKYNLKAEECVFLDDKPENIQGAKECGINCIRVQNHEQAHEKLWELLEK